LKHELELDPSSIEMVHYRLMGNNDIKKCRPCRTKGLYFTSDYTSERKKLCEKTTFDKKVSVTEV